jgi:phytanoyl-CoA hydroxylase
MNFSLSEEQLKTFQQDGYLIIPSWCDNQLLNELNRSASDALEARLEPIEREAQTGYPGAPTDPNQPGGNTPRRLLGAYQRMTLWKEFATSPKMQACLSQLFADPTIYLSQVHHNCLMTKLPDFSSDTGWHQDFRYWSFEQSSLISAWCALGQELANNGGLKVIPGSHLMSLKAEQFDQSQFFREDLEANQSLLEQAKTVQLNPGDLLFFHCNLLHAATRNYTDSPKLSLVFTYHASDNKPIANTRSSSLEEILLG